MCSPTCLLHFPPISVSLFEQFNNNNKNNNNSDNNNHNTENNLTWYCSHTSENTNVKVQNVYHAR